MLRDYAWCFSCSNFPYQIYIKTGILVPVAYHCLRELRAEFPRQPRSNVMTQYNSVILWCHFRVVPRKEGCSYVMCPSLPSKGGDDGYIANWHFAPPRKEVMGTLQTGKAQQWLDQKHRFCCHLILLICNGLMPPFSSSLSLQRQQAYCKTATWSSFELYFFLQSFWSHFSAKQQ